MATPPTHQELTTAPELDGEAAVFLRQLLEAGVLLPQQAPGVWGFSSAFEHLLEALQVRLTEIGRTPDCEVMSFPPVIARHTLERSGYLQTMPQLLGSIHRFSGDEVDWKLILDRVERGEDWGGLQQLGDVVLIPAACYPIYPLLSGNLPAAGRSTDSSCYCFRHEVTSEPGRLKAFRVREFVRAGTGGECLEWRDAWRQRGLDFALSLGLQARVELASDPFFGPTQRLLRANQRNERMKYELLTTIGSSERPMAVASFNYHRDHFGSHFEIATANGEVAHTACVGFGLERVTLALLRQHGVDPLCWPADVRGRLFG